MGRTLTIRTPDEEEKYQVERKAKHNLSAANYRYELPWKIFEHYGFECSCPYCNENNPAFLTLAHINNDGAEQRRELNRHGQGFYAWVIKNNYPEDLQTECWNCNSGKLTNNGICPHEEIEAACL